MSQLKRMQPPRKVEYAPQITRMRDSFVEDFEHHGHPEYRMALSTFENRVSLFLRIDENGEGRFRNMMRDLMKSAHLKVSFLEGEVVFTKFSAAVPKTRKHVDVRSKIARPQWAGILDTAMPRILDDLSHRVTEGTSYSYSEFLGLLTFWPKDSMFEELLEMRLNKAGYNIAVKKTVVRITKAAKGEPKRPPKVSHAIGKSFNAQQLFSIMEKSCCETMAELRAMKFAEPFTHVVTLREPNDTVRWFKLDEPIVLNGSQVFGLDLVLGDILLVNEAGAKLFRKNMACNVRKIKF